MKVSDRVVITAGGIAILIVLLAAFIVLRR